MIKCVKDLAPELEECRRDRLPFERGYRFLDYPFEIKSNSQPLADLCDHIYEGFRADRPTRRPSVFYLLEDPADPLTPYLAIDPGYNTFLCSETSQAVSFWGAQLTCNHLYRLPFLFIHAAVLDRDGRGLVFAGPSGSGKTSFVLSLAGKGFSFCSDEFAPLSLDGGEVYPFPRSLLLGRESLSRLPGVGELPYFLDDQERRPGEAGPPRRYILAPGRVFSAIGDSPVPPAALFVLDGFADTATSARPLAAGRALELLVKMAVNTSFLDPSAAGAAVEALVAILSRAPAYLLRPGPPGENPAIRAGMLEGLAAGRPVEAEDLEAIGKKCREILKSRSGIPA